VLRSSIPPDRVPFSNPARCVYIKICPQLIFFVVFFSVYHGPHPPLLPSFPRVLSPSIRCNCFLSTYCADLPVTHTRTPPAHAPLRILLFFVIMPQGLYSFLFYSTDLLCRFPCRWLLGCVCIFGSFFFLLLPPGGTVSVLRPTRLFSPILPSPSGLTFLTYCRAVL